MNAFKKLWLKITGKDKKQEEECWYNNAHEKEMPRWVPPVENMDPGGAGNGLDRQQVNKIYKRR